MGSLLLIQPEIASKMFRYQPKALQPGTASNKSSGNITTCICREKEAVRRRLRYSIKGYSKVQLQLRVRKEMTLLP